MANKLWWEFWPEQSAAAELDGSLRRMGFDYVDLIYASEPPPNMSVTALVGAVGGLIAAGKARAWGVLNWSAGTISQAASAAAALSVPPPCAAQLPYSLVRRSPVQDAEMTGALGQAGTGVVASFCLEGGILSGKYRERRAAGRAAGTLDEPRAGPAVAAAAGLRQAWLSGWRRARPRWPWLSRWPARRSRACCSGRRALGKCAGTARPSACLTGSARLTWTTWGGSAWPGYQRSPLVST